MSWEVKHTTCWCNETHIINQQPGPTQWLCRVECVLYRKEMRLGLPAIFAGHRW